MSLRTRQGLWVVTCLALVTVPRRRRAEAPFQGPGSFTPKGPAGHMQQKVLLVCFASRELQRRCMNDFCPAVRGPSASSLGSAAFSLLVLVADLERACSGLLYVPPSLPFRLPFPACVQPPRCPRKPFSREASWLPVLAPNEPATRSLGSSDQEPGLLLLGSFGLWMDGSLGHLKMWVGRAVLGAGSRLFPRLQLQSIVGMMGKGRERRSRRGPSWLPGGEGGLRNQSVCTELGALPLTHVSWARGLVWGLARD